MSDIKNYLENYFKDWDLTDSEKQELSETCEKLGNDLNGFYEIMRKMSEDLGYCEKVIDIIDSSIVGFEDDDKKDA